MKSLEKTPRRATTNAPIARAFARAALLSCCALPALAQDIELAPIVVEGDPGVVTEGSGNYTWSRVTVGGKQPQDNRDIPQTVTVLTRDVLDDANATSIEEASRLLPSLTVATGDGFVGSLYSRGQEVFQYYVDGAPRPFLSIYGTAPDLFFFDRLEVLSGPSGVFQGSGEPVGTINLVRKRPTDTFQALGGVSADSDGGYRGQADVGGPLNESGTVRGRIAAYGEHRDSFTDFAEMDAYGVFGTLEIDLTDRTTLSFGGIYEKTDTLRFSGFPTYSDGSLVTDFLPRSDFIGSTENEADIRNGEFFVDVEHRFDFGGVLKATGRIFDQDADLRNLLGQSPVDLFTNDFDLFWFARDFDQTASYADINFTAPFDLGRGRSELVIGADYRRIKQDFKQNFDFSPGTANLFTFNPEAYPLPPITFPGVGPGFRLNTTNTIDEYGIYAQVRAPVTDRFKVNLGARFSYYDARNEDTGRDLVNENDETNFAPYIGATYDVTDTVTGYASYSEIFQPQTETDAAGNVLEPRTGRQVEVGMKYIRPDGRLTAQASYFFIRDENRAETDPINPGAFTASGEADTQGVELLISGELLPQFEVITGYSYVDTDLNDPTSPQNFTFYGKYSFERGRFDGLSLGGGVRWASSFETFDDSVDVTIKAPDYAVVDAFAAYQINEHAEVQLNLTNLFDTKYVERINTATRGTYFGAPFTAVLSLNARF